MYGSWSGKNQLAMCRSILCSHKINVYTDLAIVRFARGACWWRHRMTLRAQDANDGGTEWLIVVWSLRICPRVGRQWDWNFGGLCGSILCLFFSLSLTRRTKGNLDTRLATWSFFDIQRMMITHMQALLACGGGVVPLSIGHLHESGYTPSV